MKGKIMNNKVTTDQNLDKVSGGLGFESGDIESRTGRVLLEDQSDRVTIKNDTTKITTKKIKIL